MNNLIRSVTLLLACASCVSGAEVGTQESAEPVASAEAPAAVPVDSAEMPEDAPENASDTPQMPDATDAGDSEAVQADENSEPLPPAAPNRRYSLVFHAAGVATYDDNIFISHEDAKSDLIWAFAPGFSLGGGDITKRKEGFIVLNYNATAKFFTDHNDLDSVDHNAALLGQWTGAKLTLGGFLNFRDTTDTSSEVGDRIEQKVYEGGVNGSYALSEVTTLGAEASEHISDYSGDNVDSQETDLRLWIDYDITALTKLGLGVTVGQVDLSSGPTQTFEQLLARVNYAVDTKVELNLQAGGELREVEGRSTKASPVFALGATYSPYDLLKIGVQGYRRLQPSITDAGAINTVTGVSLSLTYLFLQRLEFACNGAYERSNYDAAGARGSFAHDDDYFMARVEQSYIFTPTARVGAFYQFRTNDSSQRERSFDDRQVGLEFTLAF